LYSFEAASLAAKQAGEELLLLKEPPGTASDDARDNRSDCKIHEGDIHEIIVMPKGNDVLKEVAEGAMGELGTS